MQNNVGGSGASGKGGFAAGERGGQQPPCRCRVKGPGRAAVAAWGQPWGAGGGAPMGSLLRPSPQHQPLISRGHLWLGEELSGQAPQEVLSAERWSWAFGGCQAKLSQSYFTCARGSCSPQCFRANMNTSKPPHPKAESS